METALKAKLPSLWYRAERKVWFVTIGGKQINLGAEEQLAIRKYAQILARDLGELTETDITLHNLVKEFFHNRENFKSEATKDGYRKIMWAVLDFYNEPLLAKDLKPWAVGEWLRSIGVDTPANYNKHIAQVSRIFNWGVKMGYLSANPIKGMPRQEEKPKEDFIPSDKFTLFLYAIPTTLTRDLARFMLETGCRVREVRILEAKHWDAQRKCFTLPIEDSKGKKKSRVIFCSDVAAKLVKENWTASGPIFRNTKGQPWTAQSIKKNFGRAATAIGLDFKMSGTILRHSFAHHRLQSGQDVGTVSKLMGHSTTDCVMKIYGHLMDGDILPNAANAVKIY